MTPPQPRRAVPAAAGLPGVLVTDHPLGLAAAGLSVLAATALFADQALARFAAGLDPAVRQGFGHVTGLGDSAWAFQTALALLAICWLRARQAARHRTRVAYRHLAGLTAFVLAAVLLSGLAVNLLKRLVGRARPSLSGTDGAFALRPFDVDAGWASFPSGHATTIFAIALALCMIVPRLRLAFLSVAAWVALSRVMVGSHWMSDVVAGAALGAATVLALRPWFARRGRALIWRNGRFDPRLTGLSALLAADGRFLLGQLRQRAGSGWSRLRAGLAAGGGTAAPR